MVALGLSSSVDISSVDIPYHVDEHRLRSIRTSGVSLPFS